MTIDLADTLYRTGTAHARAACLLYRAAVADAAEAGIDDPVGHVFNGQMSLSVQHLLGLGLELMLKSVIVAFDGGVDEAFLRKEIGHDLVSAFDEAVKRGFAPKATHLPDLVAVLQSPYAKHWFRYGRPDAFALPSDFNQVVATLEALDGDVTTLLAEKVASGD